MCHTHYTNYGEIEYAGHRFKITSTYDEDAGPPWEDSDGHGPVSDWRPKESKRPGERVLCTSGNQARFYDGRAAQKLAIADGWDCTARPRTMVHTKAQTAAYAVQADFQYLKDWCEDQWRYVIVIATLLDAQGKPTKYTNSCGGVEDAKEEYILEVGKDCAAEALSDWEADQVLAQAKAVADSTIYIAYGDRSPSDDSDDYDWILGIYRTKDAAERRAALHRLQEDAAGEIVAGYAYPEHPDADDTDTVEDWRSDAHVEERRIDA